MIGSYVYQTLYSDHDEHVKVRPQTLDLKIN